MWPTSATAFPAPNRFRTSQRRNDALSTCMTPRALKLKAPMRMGKGFASWKLWCSTKQYMTGWKGLRLTNNSEWFARFLGSFCKLLVTVLDTFGIFWPLIGFLGIHLAGHSSRSSWLVTATRGSKPTCVIHRRAAGWKAPCGLVGDGLSPGSRCLASTECDVIYLLG